MKRALNIGSEKSLKEAIKLVHESVLEIIRNKKNKNNNNTNVKDDEDLLSRLLLAGYDEVLVRDLVISFVMAGRDTTSAAMTWLFWLISKHEYVEKMIEKEVKEVFEGVKMKAFDYKGLKSMDFLRACLCESMRLFPPVAWDSKHAAEDDVLPDGTVVRRGDRVTYFPYGMGRMERLWGKDCLEFRPDRWFDEPVGDDSEDDGTGVRTMKQVSPYMFPVFQVGPRVCLGKEMAYIQMKYVVASIVNRFRIEPVCDKQPVFVPLLTAHMAGGFNVRVYKKSEIDT